MFTKCKSKRSLGCLSLGRRALIVFEFGESPSLLGKSPINRMRRLNRWADVEYIRSVTCLYNFSIAQNFSPPRSIYVRQQISLSSPWYRRQLLAISKLLANALKLWCPGTKASTVGYDFSCLSSPYTCLPLLQDINFPCTLCGYRNDFVFQPN